MFAFLRRRREARARTIITAELRALAEYETGHVERQRERLAGFHSTRMDHSGRPRKTTMPHGGYAPDQRRQHVEIRLRQQMKRPPKNLRALLLEAVPDEK